MSRYRSLSHALWYCHYHIVWVPKYRFRILVGEIKVEVENVIRMVSAQSGCIIEELNVQEEHVHLLVMIPPKVSISKYVGTVKGKSAIRIFSKFQNLKIQAYWGNHFLGKRILRRYNRIGFGKN